MVEEKGKHLQAFEIYYQMGIKRKLVTLADETGIPLATIKKWAKDFNWSARVDRRDREILEEMKKNNAHEFEKACIYYQQGIRKLIRRDFLEPLLEGRELPFQIKNVKDLDILIKADVVLGGGVTSRSETISKEAKKESEIQVIELIQGDEEVWEKLNQQYLVEGEANERRDGDS